MDVNIFVYAHREDANNHCKFREWLESVTNTNEDYGYSELVLSGFLRVVTHPKIFEMPSPITDAIAFAQQVKSQPNAVKIAPKERHWTIFKELLTDTNATGNSIPDAYHAALSIESGCEWVTTDKEFKKFKGLKHRHPFL